MFIALKSDPQLRKSRIGKAGLFLLLFLAVFFLSSCGGNQGLGFPEGSKITRPNPPCTIIELPITEAQRERGVSRPILSLDITNSPEYCNRVREDFIAAMNWYQGKAQDNKYSPGMKDELLNFYTGELYRRTLTGIEYGERANQVVLGRFEITDEKISATRWNKDGYSATLVVNPGDYKMLVFSPGNQKEIKVYPGDPNEIWLVTLVYDATPGRWKISDSCATLVPLGLCPP